MTQPVDPPVDQPEHSSYDALVIGAGAGGMAAAARLNHHGYRTLLVESRDRVGGRASTMEVDGFTVNTGALVLELGGANGRLFDELGVDPGAPLLARPPVLRIGRRDIPMTSGPTGAAVRYGTAGLGALARRFPRLRPPATVHTAAWLDSLRAGPGTHRLVRNLTSALFAAEPADVPAALFFDYLTKPGALRDYGAHPYGSVGPWRALADHYERTGGVLWCDSSVTGLTVDNTGLVDGAWVRRGGELLRVATRLVVSNAGPLATVELCGAGAVPAGYAAQVRAWSRPSTLITVNFATRQPLRRLDSLVFFGSTRRLAYAANLTALSPRMAPPGWHLYAAASTPSPATGQFDEPAEVALLEADLRANFAEYDGARVLSVEIRAGQRWPAQRAIAGHDLPNTTPVPNLWNVGDGVRPWTGAGQSGCVESALLVTDQIRVSYPALRSPANG